ncbi:MAG: hypothetical protein WCG25_09840 [bacterium]
MILKHTGRVHEKFLGATIVQVLSNTCHFSAVTSISVLFRGACKISYLLFVGESSWSHKYSQVDHPGTHIDTDGMIFIGNVFWL